MRYFELSPREELAPYVRSIWGLELNSAAAFGPPDRIMPDGAVEIVFHFGTPFSMRFAGEDFARQPRSFAVLQAGKYLEIKPAGRSGFVAVRFHPWGACRFMPLPIHELTDRVVTTEQIWGSAARRLEEQLQEAASFPTRARLVESFLLRQQRSTRVDLEPLVRTIWSRGGQVEIDRLSRHTGLTQRTLQRSFATALGISPKSFARLSRFLSACSLLDTNGWQSLTQVGQACGYYDQSHFIADFQDLAGLTPGQFLAKKTSHLQIE